MVSVPQRVFLVGAMVIVCACATAPSPPGPDPCSQAWFEAIESRIGTGDGQGHGPDLGSEEWKSVVEFRLGIRGQAEVPDRQFRQWCLFIDDRVRGTSTDDASIDDAS